jgi:hypothetical protein
MKLRNFSLFQFAKTNQHQLVSIFILGLFLWVTPTAIAQFKPRTRKAPSPYTRAGGSRGCPSDENKIPLMLFAPQTYVSETVSKHPTFAWYVSAAHPVKFSLFEFDAKEKLKELGNTQNLNASPGVNKFTIASTYPELTLGKKYLWQITIRCGNGLVFERAEFQVVNMPLALKGTLSNINSTQKVSFLAEKGLWYDAFGEALKYSHEGKLGQLGSNLIQELIQFEQTGKPQDMENIKQRINNLRLISKQSS